jgi:hypothetical protein
MHHIDLPVWAVERGRRMICFDPIEPALVGIDLQNAVAPIEDGAPQAKEKSGADHAA